MAIFKVYGTRHEYLEGEYEAQSSEEAVALFEMEFGGMGDLDVDNVIELHELDEDFSNDAE